MMYKFQLREKIKILLGTYEIAHAKIEVRHYFYRNYVKNGSWQHDIDVFSDVQSTDSV